MPTNRRALRRARTTTFAPAALQAFRHWQETGDGYYALLDALNLPPWTNIEDPDEQCLTIRITPTIGSGTNGGRKRRWTYSANFGARRRSPRIMRQTGLSKASVYRALSRT